MTIEYVEEVNSDLEKITQWYRWKRAGLEKDFLAKFEAAVGRIENNPLGYQTKYGITRSALLRKFPYRILFEFIPDLNKIVIYGVIHTHRDPDFIARRLKNED
jgi:hypothetical protein